MSEKTPFSSYEVEFFGDDVSYVKAETHEKLLQAYEALSQPSVGVDELREFARDVPHQCCWCGDTSDTIIDAFLARYNVTPKGE